MKLYLFDTDTVIYFIKGHDAVVEKFISFPLVQLYISDITCAELYYGAYNSEFPERNLRTVNGVIGNLSAVPFNTSASKVFGELKAELKKKGELIADMDLMIAAIAVAGNYTLVTNNVKHFERIKNLKLENWSEYEYKANKH
ncbi:type II toxin-antitoxin system VapC family toxin [Holosporaceae bacterium 'Namur']|nr:type II toxin-antitoxin system VapC family toxin [Holosporaceae bacterium 'Namur']